MKKRMTGAQAIVEVFRLEAVEYVFCVPGESYLPLMDAIYDEKSIQLISTRHEGGAAFMAEAYAKATGKPGIAMATRGVGGANLAIGIHTAYQDSTPMVVFLGQVNSKFRGREGFQEVDLDQFFGHITKWAVEVKDAERMGEIVQRAFRVAKSGRPGPVVVSLPEDVLSDVAEVTFGPTAKVPTPRPSQLDLVEIAKLLTKARKPLVIAGGGIKLSGAEEELIAFCEKYHLPVMSSFRRHDVFPNQHPLYVGQSGLGTHKDILDTIRQADTIIAVGTRLSEVTTQDYSIFNHQPTMIHIDIDYSVLGKVYAPDMGVVADAKEALKDLLDLDQYGLNPSWKDWAKERRLAYETATKLEVAETNEPFVNPKYVIKTMQEMLPENAIITNDAGNFAGWLHAFYQFKQKNTYIGPTSGAMGYGLPAAIGAKLGQPDRTVVSLSGDGGFMMTVQELETAVRYHVPIISLVFNNNMYGTIRMHQELVFPEREIGTALGEVHFEEVARSLGVTSFRVTTDQEFEQAFKKALTLNKPVLIEIKTNPEQISVHATISQLRERARNK